MRRHSNGLAAHDHEWDPDSYDILLEDRRAHVVQHCNWAEVVSSTHSEAHDETFYGYGAECEETRTVALSPAWFGVTGTEDGEIPSWLRETADASNIEQGDTIQFPTNREEYGEVHDRVLEHVESMWADDGLEALAKHPRREAAVESVEADTGSLVVWYDRTT